MAKVSKSILKDISQQLEILKSDGLFKEEREIISPQQANIKIAGGKEVLNLCANNYLGLANNQDVIAYFERR